MLPHLNLSVDLIIIGTFAFMAAVGTALGAERLRAFALSVYVGLVLAYELGGPASDFLSSHGTNLTPGRVRLVLFTLPVLILSLTHHSKRGRRGGFIFSLVLSVLLAALIVSSAFHLMDADMAAQLLGNSSLALPLLNLRFVWLGAVPVAAVLAVLAKPKKSH